ncbi:peptidoglycan-binding domain-containing protein [Candidatus Electronema sp. PJ]|uniref:peptidoglycan-binding domain-containing protein n=1 Tax=Candidatus Electronema sp. PJ TaxID=3401572 RepID=UPI003AA7C60B
MRRKKLVSGVMMLALLGFAAERSLAEEVVIDQEQEVVDQGQGEVIVDQEQDVDAEQEQEVIVDPKKGGYHPPSGQCKASNPPVNGQCIYLNLKEKEGLKHKFCPKQDEFTPIIQTGECWSQCIYPGRMGKTYKPVKTCIDCDQVVQNGTQTITKKEVVRIVTPGVLKRKCIEKPSGHYEYKVVWPKPKTVMIKDCTPNTTPLPSVCRKKLQSVTVTYERPTLLTHTITHPISFPYSWEDLYRRPVPCPPNGKGGTDCSSVCNETKPGHKTVEIEKCIDKVVQEPGTIVKQYFVTVCEPDSTNPPPCQITRRQVQGEPQIIKVPIMEKVCSDRVIIGQPEPTYGTVTFKVPDYKVVPKPPVIDCIGVPPQVCKPVLVWRQEAFCQDKGNHSGLITQVQEALVQEGFDAGPADGVLNDKTKQAIVDFQKAKGLAQGGTLTKETVEALGISQ